MELQQGLQFLNHKVNKTQQVENNSNFDFNNEKYNNELSYNSRGNTLHIGKEVNNIFDKITEFVGINSLEGFQQKKSRVDKKNDRDLSELASLENTLNRLLSEYSQIHKGLMSNTKDYLENSEDSIKGKNIYVTEPKIAITNSGQVKNIEYVGCYDNNSDINRHLKTKQISAKNDDDAFNSGYQIAQQNGNSYFSVWKNSNGSYAMSMSNTIGDKDNVGIDNIVDNFNSRFSKSNKIVTSWSSGTKGATEAILTPWGTIEMRNKNKKVIWSSSGTPGQGPISTCAVNYSKLDVNAGSLQESTISATMGGNCNGKLKPGTSSRYRVKTGNFNENVKGWLETPDALQDGKFKVHWTDSSPGDCCDDKNFLRYYNTYNDNPSRNKNTQCTKYWYDRNCRGNVSRLNAECNRYNRYASYWLGQTRRWRRYERRASWWIRYYYRWRANRYNRYYNWARSKYNTCIRNLRNIKAQCDFCQKCKGKCGNKYIDQLSKPPTTSDPAPGCNKEFTSSYKCGNSLKSTTVEGSSHNKLAEINCGLEMLACTFEFTMRDNGNFTIEQVFGDIKKIDKGNMQQESNGNTEEEPNDNAENSKNTVWQTQTTITDQPNSGWISSKGLKGKSMFVSGEEEIILRRGEFIGSVNGKSRLYLAPNGELKIQYFTPTCNKLGGTGAQERRMGSFANTSAGEESYGESLAMYRIKGIGNENLGKVAYINEEGKLQEYPNSLLGFGSEYIEKPNYTSDIASKNIIKEMNSGGNVEICKNECNKNTNCAGFNLQNGKCILANENMYPKNKKLNGPDNNSKIFMRERTVRNHSSCSSVVRPVDSSEYDSYPMGDRMNRNQLCGLGTISESEFKKLKRKNAEIKRVVNRINKHIGGLVSTRSDLSAELTQKKKDVNENLKEYQKNYDLLQKQVDVSKFNTLTGIFDVSNISYAMEEHQTALTAGVAIVLILACYKMYKSRRVN